jgi:hypothetical protein
MTILYVSVVIYGGPLSFKIQILAVVLNGIKYYCKTTIWAKLFPLRNSSLP